MNYGIFQEAATASLHLKLLSLCQPQEHAAATGGRTQATTAAPVAALLHALARPPHSPAPAGRVSRALAPPMPRDGSELAGCL